MYVISQVIKTATVLYLVSLPIGMLLGAPKVFMIVGMGVFVTCYSLAGESQSCKPSCRDIWGSCDASMMHWQLQLEGSAQSLQAQYMIFAMCARLRLVCRSAGACTDLNWPASYLSE